MAGIEDRVNNWLKNPWTLAHRPFKVVDNVYFVGTSWVSAFLLNTQKGLVLIDCAMQETLYLLVDSIRELGFNPRQIKKLLLTHGHFDHCGAARAIKEMSGCEIWLGKDDEYFFTERRDLIAFEDHVSGFPIDRFFNYRKMAIDGYVVKLDLPELRELVSLLRYSSNNLNQLTRRVHETGRVYAADMEDILQNQERIWQAASGILSRLAAIK